MSNREFWPGCPGLAGLASAQIQTRLICFSTRPARISFLWRAPHSRTYVCWVTQGFLCKVSAMQVTSGSSCQCEAKALTLCHNRWSKDGAEFFPSNLWSGMNVNVTEKNKFCNIALAHWFSKEGDGHTDRYIYTNMLLECWEEIFMAAPCVCHLVKFRNITLA